MVGEYSVRVCVLRIFGFSIRHVNLERMFELWFIFTSIEHSAEILQNVTAAFIRMCECVWQRGTGTYCMRFTLAFST